MSLLDSATRLSLPLTPRPLVKFFARRYVAGSTFEEAAATVQRLTEEGCCATIDVLGESVDSPELARRAVDDYLRVLEEIPARQLDANVSLKPTQMGLGIDEELCHDNIATILESAAAKGIFVRVDMEDATTTDATLRVCRRLKERFSDYTGVVLQARLRRTLSDAAELTRERTNVRVCKGIYLEPRTIGYEEHDIIRNNFMHTVRLLLEGGCYVGIATHDEWLVCESLALIHRLGLAADRYEFQMLLGVDPELRRIIVSGGHRLRVYVPFGSHWYPYSVRRLRENPSIARAGLEAFLRGRVDS